MVGKILHIPRILPGQNPIPRSYIPIWILVILFFSITLSGCVHLADLESSQEFRSHTIGIATTEQQIGQSIQSLHHSPFSLQVWLRPQENAPTGSMVIVEIFSEPGSSRALAQFNYPLQELADGQSISIPMDSISNLTDGAFYISLHTTGGAVEVLGRNEDAYPHGSAFLNGNPNPTDLAFNLSYTYNFTESLADIKGWLSRSWLLLPFTVLLIIPGWLLLSVFGHKQGFDWGERVALYIGVSMSLIPVLLLWTTTIGMRWSGFSVYTAAGVLLVIFIWQQIRHLRMKMDNTQPKISRNFGINLGLIAIFLLSLVVRLIMVRDLATPAWVDSVHHATITRLILEHGAYPDTYAPYLELDTASYHSGYHANLAAFLGLARLDLAQGMLIYGQMLNALSIFAVYLFTKTLVRNQVAGLLAAMFAGLFTPMPAYYTSWGRYTQLAGLLIFPVAIALILKAQENSSSILRVLHRRMPHDQGHSSLTSIGWLVLAGLVCGGLFLVHYRVLAFVGCMLVAWLIVETVSELRQPGIGRKIREQLIILVLIAIFAILLTLPWWPATLNSLIIPFIDRSRNAIPLFSDFSWSLLNAGHGIFIVVLAVIGTLWGMIQRQRFAYIIALWIILLFALANPGQLLPAIGGMVNNTSVAITLFMPAAAMAGYLVGWVLMGWLNFIPDRWKFVYKTGIVIILSLLSLYSARSLISILNPITILSRQSDLDAIHWIDENLPNEAVVAIHPFMWGYGIYAGSDGGYWITPLTGRRTIPSPVLYGLEFYRDSSQEILNTSRLFLENSNDPQQLAEILHQAGIDYLFIGRRTSDISPAQIGANPSFEQLYARDGVYIFRILPDS